MSNFPLAIDDDISLPAVNNNLSEIGDIAINALRDAVVAIEQNIGIGAAGTTFSLSARLGVSFNPDGTLKPSAFTSLSLASVNFVNITNNQIANYAAIQESKLNLDIPTLILDGYITDLARSVNTALGWISVTGVKLDPHLSGNIYRHTMSQIDVNSPYLKNRFGAFRDNINSYNLVNDINNEFLKHQLADGSQTVAATHIITNDGSNYYPATHAHTASGIFLHTSRFSVIPQTADDMQKFAEFIETSSIFLLGTRIQNLYSNGISRISRSTSLIDSEHGTLIIPSTPAIAYLKNVGNASYPFDDIDTGDDIIEFKPAAPDKSNFSFDAKFALIKVGDIITVNYGDVIIPFVIKEKKYILSSQKYIVRVAGKNHIYTATATATVNRLLANNNKLGVLSIAAANNNFSELPSLIVGTPRGGEVIGIGFSPDQFDDTHYLLYLVLYPTGTPQSGVQLPPIDVTGNAGATPGLYSLDSIVASTNDAFRKAGYNYRFTAFSYKGEFGIMLADSYNNTGFSIINGIVATNGFFDQTATTFTFANNVIGLFPTDTAKDPLGFGPNRSNISSPPYSVSYASAEASQSPTKLFMPLARNNYYVNGAEKSRLNLEAGQIVDGYGDGYWIGRIVTRDNSLSGRLEVIYSIPHDLSSSKLKIGKTIVAQSYGQGGLVDFGRFIIKNVNFNCPPGNYTEITVYDAIHAVGFSPTSSLALDGYVALYFNSDSVSFNKETATDFNNLNIFKRHFEAYTTQDGDTFTHERGRIVADGSSPTINAPYGTILHSYFELSKLDIIKISTKLRGYQFGTVTKITLHVNTYDSASGVYDGYLAKYDGYNLTRLGPTTSCKKGETNRFYDETNLDFIDLTFDINLSVSSFSNQNIDFQLFPTLSLDDEIMLIGTCQLNDTTKYVSRLRDERQFGNIGEKDLSTSALNFIALPDKLLHFNGVIKGLDITGISNEFISLTGGTALVNGKLQNLNDQIFTIPRVQEVFSATDHKINWILCANSIGELVSIPMTDYDSLLGTPSSPNRLVSVRNINLPTNVYTIDSSSFSNLLNNRKDLTALYIISSTVSGSGPSAIFTLGQTDVKRFVNDQDSNIPAVVGSDNAQCNFKSFTSAATWVRLNNNFQNTIQIKGSASASIDPRFTNTGYNSVNIINQGANASLTFSSSVNMSNVNFTGLTLTFSSATLNNVSFTDCSVTFTSTLSATGCRINNCSTFSVANAVSTFNNNNIINSNTTFSSILNAINSNFNNCGTFSVGAAATFDNINFVNSSTVTFSSTLAATNCNFNNCSAFSVVFLASLDNVDFLNSVINFSSISAVSTPANNKNVTFNNCNITITGTSTLTGISGTPGVLFNNSIATFGGAVTTSNVKFEDCILTFSSGGTFTDTIIDPSTINIGGTITIGVGNKNTTITDCNINITVHQAFILQSWFRFERNNITYTYSVAPGGYNTTDLVNASVGMIYANIASANLTDIIIKDNSFTTALSDRPSFVSLQLSAYDAVVENVNISNNKFISTASSDDLRAVISIISTLTVSGAFFPKNPKLVNIFIENNMCNYNQMILVSTQRTQGLGTPFDGAMLSTTNVKISNNTCGTIGFITASAGAYTLTNVGDPNYGFIRDKEDQLIISDNFCKLIANIDFRGDYIPFRSTHFPDGTIDYVTRPTGAYCISNNTVNWIQVGCSNHFNSPILGDGATIINNRVHPANPAYLNFYNDANISNLAPSNVGILLRRESDVRGNTYSIISGNIISQKSTLDNLGASITYYYDAAIVCFNNANITNNIIFDVVNFATNPSPSVMLYLYSACDAIVTGNNFNRNGLGIQAYIQGQDNAVNNVTIINNIFDSRFVNISGTNDVTGINIPVVWTFHNNKNQTAYKSIRLEGSINLSNNIRLASTSAAVPAVTAAVEPDTSGFYPYTSTVGTPKITSIERVVLNNTGGSADTQYYNFMINLDEYLPVNVSVSNILCGIVFTPNTPYPNNGLSTSVETSFKMDVGLFNSAEFNSTSSITLAGSQADVWPLLSGTSLVGGSSFAAATPITLNGASQINTMLGITRYLEIITTSNTLKTGKGNQITVRIETNASVIGNAISYIYYSPLLIKYHWS